MISEKEKCRRGELYDANYDPELLRERTRCKELYYRYNQLPPSRLEERERIIREMLGKTGERFLIEQPFYCDYGYNIEVGENFYANMNCVILDEAKVTFGDNVFVAPNCGFYTAGHPLDVERRNRGLEYARPITVGSNVWIGAQVCVLPGVTIGDNCVIGAGSIRRQQYNNWRRKRGDEKHPRQFPRRGESVPGDSGDRGLILIDNWDNEKVRVGGDGHLGVHADRRGADVGEDVLVQRAGALGG